MSNSLDPVQARHSVGPDLGLNCLQRLSADNTSRLIQCLHKFFQYFSDCFFRQEEFNFSLQDYHQALELDPNDETIKSRISVIHNEFGVSAYQDKMYSVSWFS